jgi:hypothetical protein
MSMMLLYLAAFSQVVVLYFISGPAHVQAMRMLCLRRNPAWLAEHPALRARAALAGRLTALHVACGLACLAWLALAVAQGETSPVLVMATVPPWLACELGCGAFLYYRVYRAIAPPPRRSASLAPRTLADLVSAAALYPAAFLLALIAGLYLLAWRNGVIDTGRFAWYLAGIALGVALWGATLAYCLRRRKRVADEDEDRASRRREILQTVACLYLFDLFHLYKLAAEVWRVDALPDTGYFIVASLALQTLALLAPRAAPPYRKELACQT